MAELNITELDFADIKTNLKTYLAAQNEFTDYDFNGSALSLLLDVLAYNTHYNAVLANLQANEMFIDTAIKRSSVTSIAKMLGYTPRSTTSAIANVNITVPRIDTVGVTLTITPSNKFSATINDETFTFNVNESQTATLNQSGNFVFTSIDLIEGIRLSNSFTIVSDNVSGPLVIPNNSVDTSTISVSVQTSVSDITETTWTKASNILDVTSTSKVFWVEENKEGKFQLVFGDDNVGAKLTAGNIVTISYIVSRGSVANGARTFTLIGDIDGEETATLTINSAAANGAEKETIDSIRHNAPKFNANRNRAVTSDDYRTIIKQNLSKAREVTVWGGEENSPPIYGKVFISVDTVSGQVLTEADKDYITETLLRPRSVMSIQHEFVDPDYLYLGLTGTVNYDPKLTTLKAKDLSALVKAEIELYFSTELGTLSRTFILSRVQQRVKDLNRSVVGSLFKMNLQKRLSIGAGASSAYSQVLNYLTAIDPETVVSSVFTTTVNGVEYTGYLQDFSDTAIQDDTGTGTLYFVNKEDKQKITSYGTVNYETGIVTLKEIKVTRYVGNVNKLYLNARPQPLYQNITSGLVRASDISKFAVTALPAKNTIVTLDNSLSIAEANIKPGLVINSVPFNE